MSLIYSESNRTVLLMQSLFPQEGLSAAAHLTVNLSLARIAIIDMRRGPLLTSAVELLFAAQGAVANWKK